ncbi:MAG: 50S ribosomal protein L18 [Phycisphaerae bacterium]
MGDLQQRMRAKWIKTVRRQRRKRRVRKKVQGTAERPRLTVSRAHKSISAQIIDDQRGVTLCQASTRNKDLSSDIAYGGNKSAAERIGTVLADRAKEQGIKAVTFDRNGYKYHGRVKSLADAAREGGLKF